MTLVIDDLRDLAAKDPRAFAIAAQFASDVASGAIGNVEGLRKTVHRIGGDDALAKVPEAGNLSAAAFADAVSQVARTTTPEAGNCCGYAAKDSSGHLEPYGFSRRTVGSGDVRIQLNFCGMCYSDVHQIRNDWTGSIYPMVPGHELVGIVTETGSDVTDLKVGDRVGVGCYVESCQSCSYCTKDASHHCPSRVFTYNSKNPRTGEVEMGGYSDHTVVRADHVNRIPANLPLSAAAPLLCAGITVYSPLRRYNLDKPGVKVGVLGLGGLGHMAVKIAAAMGCEVTVLTRSASKAADAARLGAKHVLVSTDADAMAKAASSLDGIIDTVSEEHDVNAYMQLLDVGGKYVVLGLPPKAVPLNLAAVTMRQLQVVGSLIGSVRECQEMLDFCGEHNITADIELVPASYVNEAVARLDKADVKYRFVLDIEGTLVHA